MVGDGALQPTPTPLLFLKKMERFCGLDWGTLEGWFAHVHFITTSSSSLRRLTDFVDWTRGPWRDHLLMCILSLQDIFQAPLNIHREDMDRFCGQEQGTLEGPFAHVHLTYMWSPNQPNDHSKASWPSPKNRWILILLTTLICILKMDTKHMGVLVLIQRKWCFGLLHCHIFYIYWSYTHITSSTLATDIFFPHTHNLVLHGVSVFQCL